MFGNTTDDDFWIVVVNGGADATNIPLAIIVYRDLALRGGATVWTKFHNNTSTRLGGQLAVGAAVEQQRSLTTGTKIHDLTHNNVMIAGFVQPPATTAEACC